MKNLQAVIFLHSRLSEANLKKVFSLFERMILFQPWFMEKALPMAEGSPGMVQVMNPPERLKPKEDFRNLLAEYRQWIKFNDDRAFPAFLAYAEDRNRTEPAVSEIRGMLRSGGKPVEEDENAGALKWHAILHLAGELEEEQHGAASMLRVVGGMDSPLKGALEEDSPGLFVGEGGMGSETLYTEERLTQILEAWVALFGQKVQGRGPLITLNPEVMKYVAETWEEFALGRTHCGRPVFTFSSPDLSALGMDELLKRREAYVTATGLRQAIMGLLDDPERGFSPLKREAAMSVIKGGALQWVFLYLSPVAETRFPRRYKFMKTLSGKVIGFLKDSVGNEG